MKSQRLRFKARGKLFEMGGKQFEMKNAQLGKMTRGYDPRPKGMNLRNKHRQVSGTKPGK